MRKRINKGHVAKALPNGELRLYTKPQKKSYVKIFGKEIPIKPGEEKKYEGLKIYYK